MSTGRPQRPLKLHPSKSFTRFEPTHQSPQRSRASTLSTEVLPPQAEVSKHAKSKHDQEKEVTDSIFEKPEENDDLQTSRDSTLTSPTDNLPADFDELPIEIASWADRFVNELTSAKIFSTPPSIDDLSEIFQDFYVKAEVKIATHIRILQSRQSRAASPAPSIASRASIRARPSPRLGAVASKESLRRVDGGGGGAQPMLTPGEVHEKRRARRLLEYKRVVLEEAVERRVCEALYPKLWRHKNTLDDVRDEKLRSKTGSLQLVGIGLKELGIDLDADEDAIMTTAERVVMVDEWISKAAEGLLQMDEPHDPKGKLDSLIAAHQKIVDLLTKVRKSSSSADEILPTLIYCLIACPAEGLNIISNMEFIQRFRAGSKMNGEAAYCLTNLEAAITFLETVDLASLRAEEAQVPNASVVDSQPATPLAVTFEPSRKTSAAIAAPATTNLTVAEKERSSSATSQRPLIAQTSSQHRRLSSLISVPSTAFNAANDAVRNTADHSFRSVSTTLDNSFKLLFGRLLEQQQAQSVSLDSDGKSIVMPKTLDDARKLVAPKPNFDEDGTVSEGSSFREANEDHPLRERSESSHSDDKLLDMIAGKPRNIPIRDRSADSRTSDNSSIRQTSTTPQPTAVMPGAAALDNAAEAFRTFGNSINPLNRLSGAGFMRGFGRTITPPALENTVTVSVPAAASIPLPAETKNKPQGDLTIAGEGPVLAKLDPPPRSRFMELQHANELRIGEIQELLNEYHRVVECLQVNCLI